MAAHWFPAFLSQCVASEFVSKAKEQHRSDEKSQVRAEFPEEDLHVWKEDIIAGWVQHADCDDMIWGGQITNENPGGYAVFGGGGIEQKVKSSLQETIALHPDTEQCPLRKVKHLSRTSSQIQSNRRFSILSLTISYNLCAYCFLTTCGEVQELHMPKHKTDKK